MDAIAAIATLMLASGTIQPAQAEVKQSSPENFVITISTPIKAPPAKVYVGLGDIGRWWNAEHSYSGDAANLSLDVAPGGCFCERWKDGSAEHGRVIMAFKDKTLRLQAPLGPLQGRAVNAVLTFALKPQEAGTLLETTFLVNGNASSALDRVATAVDGVLSNQVARLARYVETGSPIVAPAR